MEEDLASAARAAGLEDLDAPLHWLAWRHPSLEAYTPSLVTSVDSPNIDALVVLGCSLVAGKCNLVYECNITKPRFGV